MDLMMRKEKLNLNLSIIMILKNQEMRNQEKMWSPHKEMKKNTHLKKKKTLSKEKKSKIKSQEKTRRHLQKKKIHQKMKKNHLIIIRK
jgi:hypothetical protein